MLRLQIPTLNSPPSPSLSLVIGSGGTRTILSSAGSMLALEYAGAASEQFETIGGISGGAITAFFYAAGYSAKQIAQIVIELDFTALLDKTGFIATPVALFFKDYFSWKRPSKGALSTEKLGHFIDSKINRWPENFWTIAASGDSIILFRYDGVYEVFADGTRIQLGDSPAPPGLALRASCAVPGLLEPVEYKGRLLYDGVLTRMKRCPVDLPVEQLNIAPEAIIAVDSGEEPGPCISASYKFWGTVFGGVDWLKNKSNRKLKRDDVSMIRPQLGKLPALRFKLSPLDKWLALFAGLIAGLEILSDKGYLPETKKPLLSELRALCAWAALPTTDSELAVFRLRSCLILLEMF